MDARIGQTLLALQNDDLAHRSKPPAQGDVRAKAEMDELLKKLSR